MKDDDFLDTDSDIDSFSNDDFLNNDDNFFNDDADLGGDTNLNKHNDLLKELTNFDPSIQRKIRNWLGLEWDEKIQGYTQKQEAVINERGARWCIGFLQTYQAKTNFITNISQREYNYYAQDIAKMCWLILPTIDNFGVIATADYYRICTELEHSALLVLQGAGDGKYTKFFGESVHRTESYNVNGQPTGQPLGVENGIQPKTGLLENMRKKLLGRI